MNEKVKPKNKTIGLNIREAKQRLDELIVARQKVTEEMIPFMPNQYGDTPLKFIELSQKRNSIDNEIVQVREWYNIGLAELLHDESKRLNVLTKWLIILTIVLVLLGILSVIDLVR